jgi:hypothetical protein
VLYLLHRKPSKIALLEIDYSRDRAYPSVPQPRCRDLFDSHVETTRSHLVMEELDYLPLGWYYLFLSKCFCSVMLFLTRRYRISIHIYRDITCLNRCEYTFSGNRGANASFQPKFIWSTYRLYKFNSLCPHSNLKDLTISNYGSKNLSPTWLKEEFLPNLTQFNINDCVHNLTVARLPHGITKLSIISC